jgi:tRNA C32,U32 (ribose-2'-O)-methylase TrmJ
MNILSSTGSTLNVSPGININLAFSQLCTITNFINNAILCYEMRKKKKKKRKEKKKRKKRKEKNKEKKRKRKKQNANEYLDIRSSHDNRKDRQEERISDIRME